MIGTTVPPTITQPATVAVTSRRRDRLPQGPNMLFAYGTLQFDAVLDALLGRIPQRTPASAPGWRAAALEGRLYPGLVTAPNATAPGLLLSDLSKEEWAILDAFEDDRYDLAPVALTSGDQGWAYIWPDEQVRTENWDAKHFQARHLREYAARCARISATLTRHPAGGIR